MKVFITCLGTETNTFSNMPTGMTNFEEAMLYHGDATASSTALFAMPLVIWREEAEAAGAEVLIAKGQDAGGDLHGRTPTFDLLPAVLETTALPVVASGGINNGKGLARAFSLGAQGVQCGTFFLATPEFFADDDHKQRVVTAPGEDTVLTDGFVLNWPKGSVVRVLRNSVTETFSPALRGHDPERIAHEAIARDGPIPRLRQSTASPLRTTAGDLGQMPFYSGTGAGEIDAIVSAAQRLNTLGAEAQARLASARQTPTVGQT